MFSKKSFFYILLSAFVVLNQNFQCVEETPSGLIELSVNTNDSNNQPISNTMVGLFNTQNCLLDTFYTDNLGKRAYTFFDEGFSNLSLKIIGHGVTSNRIGIISHQQSITLTSTTSAPFLSVDIKENSLDAIKIYIYPSSFLEFGSPICTTSNLPSDLAALDSYHFDDNLIQQNHVFQVIPQASNFITVQGFKNDTLTIDSLFSVPINTELKNISLSL